jgi:hypothetical protein
MPKYYIQSGSLRIIYSTSKGPIEAACDAIWELNDNDTLDEHMTVDERGMRTLDMADEYTKIYKTEFVLAQAGWSTDE